MKTNKKKFRIVEVTFGDSITYTIQEPLSIFGWYIDWWIDVKSNFTTLEEAKKNLKYFDGTENTERVVYTNWGSE